MNGFPLITVALPLHRSARFLDIIRNNLDRLEGQDIEILISDRHLLDDALDRLEEEYGHDPRIRILRANDGIGWVDHFNELLKSACGQYFMWMPHDDDFPADYLPKLLAAMEQHPTAIVAFGKVDTLDRAGRPHDSITLPPPESYDPGDWSTRLLLHLLTQWNPGIAFRGLFRREPLIENGLFIRHTRRDVLADYYWVFATGFLGPWVYVPDCLCSKRYYRKSTHGKWTATPKNWLSGFLVLTGYLRRLAPGMRDLLYAELTVLLWAWDQALRNTTDRSPRWMRFMRPLQPAATLGVNWLVRSPKQEAAAPTRTTQGEQAASLAGKRHEHRAESGGHAGVGHL